MCALQYPPGDRKQSFSVQSVIDTVGEGERLGFEFEGAYNHLFAFY